MLDYSERVERLIERFSEDDTKFNTRTAERLLAAADNVCGAIYGIATTELSDNVGYWNRLDLSMRQEISFTYSELGRQGKNLSDSRGILVTYQGGGYGFPADLDGVINDSGIAQYVAHFNGRIGESLDTRAIRLLIMAALAALLKMQALTDVVTAPDRRDFFSGRIDSGLLILEKLLAPREED